MSKKSLFILSTIVLSVVAFGLTRVIWPDPVGSVMPEENLLPFFVVFGVFESLAFGLGMSLLIFYFSQAQKHLWAFLSIVWLLASWWPHDNMHRVMDEQDFQQLLFLEYGFHFTLMAAGAILASFFVKTTHAHIK